MPRELAGGARGACVDSVVSPCPCRCSSSLATAVIVCAARSEEERGEPDEESDSAAFTVSGVHERRNQCALGVAVISFYCGRF